ncbi:hypothetical protein [Entomospira culicis]|uniref:Flagellar biosynthesis protein FlhF n=1 Tax=Entomospira culicis TaxID=2719989 RepID=A0A968GF61_9SPIO|nr:hypothetical protein [Entomospira culicis]NIZ18678.1 hypothetical protein [Entomospira culicis]NIZ68893.1 hypothetical protein [Entomospira culicis]WDI37486.1 hypothetical protein PVA46_01475 [Entomospira culicis]WDI39114.1 hypothetical protein PVA47_01480 [Entomospira culicis]
MRTTISVIETADTLDEALAKLNQKYGSRILSVTHRYKTEGGILGLGGREVVQVEAYIMEEEPDSRRQIIEKKAEEIREATRIAEQVKRENDLSKVMQTLLQKMETLEHHVEKNSLRTPTVQEENGHPSLQRIRSILIEDNDFSPFFADSLIEAIKKDFSLGELDDFALVEEAILQEIANKLSFARELPKSGTRVIVLVGPTGVGKTTSLVKMATLALTRYGSRDVPLDIRLFNMDIYRVGAKEQLGAYGEILGVEPATIYDAEELKNALQQAKDADYVFIDTTGNSPRDTVKLAEVQKILEVTRNADIHVAVSATTKESDIREILSRFVIFGYKSVIITKMDETRKIGSVLSPIIEKRVPIAFITTGQEVLPANIKSGSVARIWERMMGFSDEVLDRMIEKAEERNR